MPKPRLLFIGTPDFAVPALKGLLLNGYPVVGVVTQPDRPQGRGRATAPSPVKLLAESLGLTVLQPEKVEHSSFLEIFREAAPDLVIVAAFGQVLPKEIIHGPRQGCINIHPSLLPKYPGLHTHARAIEAGDKETGCTVHFVNEVIDGGKRIMQARVPISPGDTEDALSARVLKEEHQVLPSVIKMFAEGKIDYANWPNEPVVWSGATHRT